MLIICVYRSSHTKFRVSNIILVTGGTTELIGAVSRGRNSLTLQLLGVAAMLLVASYDVETFGQTILCAKHGNRHYRTIIMIELCRPTVYQRTTSIVGVPQS